MADTPRRERRFNDEEVALIIKRAAELQQTERVEPSALVHHVHSFGQCPVAMDFYDDWALAGLQSSVAFYSHAPHGNSVCKPGDRVVG